MTTKQSARVNWVKLTGNSCWQLQLCVGLPCMQAGQYLHLLTEEGDERPFSLASNPLRDSLGNFTVELLVGAKSKDSTTAKLMQTAQSTGKIDVEGPFGEATLKPDNPNGNHLFIAYDTGASYVHSLLEAAVKERPHAKLSAFLYLREMSDQYLSLETHQRIKDHPNLDVHVSVGDYPSSAEVARDVLARSSHREPEPGLNGIYIGAGFERSKGLASAFLQTGINAASIIGDHLTKG